MPQPDSSREMGSGNILGRVMILQAWSGRLRGGTLAQGMPRNLSVARAGKKTFIVSRGKSMPFSKSGGFSVRLWDS